MRVVLGMKLIPVSRKYHPRHTLPVESHVTYRSILIKLPGAQVVRVRNRVARHPLIPVSSTLGSYFGDVNNRAQIYLQPLANRIVP